MIVRVLFLFCFVFFFEVSCYRYTFEVLNGGNAAAVVAEIDRRSLRLEKSIAAGQSGVDSPVKSPRGAKPAAPVVFDAELEANKPKQKVTQVQGSRFRVKLIHVRSVCFFHY